MPGTRPYLCVEGRDDKYAIVNLLIHHGMDYGEEPWPPTYPEIREMGGIDPMLDGMPVAIQLSTGRPIGFVLDADCPISDRWVAAQGRIRSVGVDMPDAPPADGFIGTSRDFGTRVGIWLMPDNQSDGDLEEFLARLVDAGDAILPHARTATGQAVELGAQFPQSSSRKAVIHAWLAWQEEPGLPYGTAVRAHYFRHDHSLVQRFVNWVKLLYGI